MLIIQFGGSGNLTFFSAICLANFRRKGNLKFSDSKI